VSREAHLAAIAAASAKRDEMQAKFEALEPDWFELMRLVTDVVGEDRSDLPEGRNIQDMQRHPMGMGALIGRLMAMKLQLDALRELV
jgi:hypothetical protein